MNIAMRRARITCTAGLTALALAGGAEADDAAGARWSFDPAPEVAIGNWTHAVIGRLQLDATTADADLDGFADAWSDSEVRRARLGIDGSWGDDAFRYRAEMTFAEGGDTTWEDVWLRADAGDFDVIVGNWRLPVSLNQSTSSRFLATMERAGFTNAFNFGRRTGVGVIVNRSQSTFTAGLFGDNINDDRSATAEGFAAAARYTFNPAVERGTVHLGGSVLYREADDGLFRYRDRPAIHLSDRFVDTGAFADSDLFAGLEAAFIDRKFYASGELGILNAEGPGEDATFSGAYVEAGYFLTDDSRGYSGDAFGRTEPGCPVGRDGCRGAWELRGRVDRLDLDDGPTPGGTQTAFTAGVNWHLNNHLRVLAEATHADVDGGPDGSGDVRSASMRIAADW